MEVETDSKEVIDISVDSVLGELQSVLKGKIPESDSSSESEEDVPMEKGPQSPQKQKEGHVCNNKTDEEKMVENSTVSPVSPKSFMDRPIIFKTSIKKDPGSKLHDQLVKELGSVLKKRNKENDLDPVKEEEKKVNGELKNNNRRPGPLKLNNSVFANKALLAHLENHLKKSLHKTDVAGKPRTSIKDSSFNNDSSNLPNIMESSISGAAQFGVKLRHTQVRTSEGDGVEMNGELSPNSSHTSPQKSSQSEILLQARASLTSNPQPKVPSQNSLTSKTDKVVVPLQNSRTAKTDRVVVQLQNKVVATTASSESRHIVSQSSKAISVVSKQTSQSGGSVYHVSSLKRDGKHMTQISIGGCPVIHTIDEGGLPSASGPGLYKGQEDKEAVFYVDVGKRSGDLDIKVEGPNSIAKTTVERAGEKFIVNYTPVEVGVFNIGILWNGTPIPGSPFHPKVFDPRKVRISGGWAQYMDGNERVGLVVGEEKRLVFDVSQAGPGSLRAEVVGPGSTVPATVTDSYGQTLVAFVPREEGNHYIHLYWADVALPNSPFLGYAVPAFSDANKVILTGRGLKEATVREEAEFVIDGSQAGPGAPEVTLTGVRAEINVKIVNLGGGKHRCTYVPVVPGAYLLNITWNGRQLRGSPYKVNVMGTFYPNKVNVSGEGLRGGILGRSMDVAIDTRKAGPGELTAYCMGPSKASYCELQDNHDGTFILKIKAQEPGKHVLQVKYGGEHVNGSPFVLKVNAQPDASKVRVTGPGVEHGILATYQSRFIVETRGAGAGQLTVRIRGPKGGFQVEMYRDSQRDRTILCRYDPTETGLYIISVRWSGVDVPGSPFQIHIVDTQQELEQILHDQSFSHSSVTPRSYAQWREEI